MVVSMLAVGFTTTNAATVDSAAAGVSKIESADDFTWDNANVYFLLTDRFYNGDTSNDHSYGRTLDANGNPLSGWNTAPCTFHGGDFAGITQKINEGYFDNMGVNAIWISAPYEQIHGFVDSGGESQPAHFAHYSYHGYYVLD
ncbi:MAG: alpha-amylase, partial [Ruminococcus sp.]|nr:alpha-amylase [Ruminococcus sp.]